jgi:hypothetical protein
MPRRWSKNFVAVSPYIALLGDSNIFSTSDQGRVPLDPSYAWLDLSFLEGALNDILGALSGGSRISVLRMSRDRTVPFAPAVAKGRLAAARGHFYPPNSMNRAELTGRYASPVSLACRQTMSSNFGKFWP